MIEQIYHFEPFLYISVDLFKFVFLLFFTQVSKNNLDNPQLQTGEIIGRNIEPSVKEGNDSQVPHRRYGKSHREPTLRRQS